MTIKSTKSILIIFETFGYRSSSFRFSRYELPPKKYYPKLSSESGIEISSFIIWFNKYLDKKFDY